MCVTRLLFGDRLGRGVTFPLGDFLVRVAVHAEDESELGACREPEKQRVLTPTNQKRVASHNSIQFSCIATAPFIIKKKSLGAFTEAETQSLTPSSPPVKTAESRLGKGREEEGDRTERGNERETNMQT